MSQKMTQIEIAEIVKKFGKKEGDTGSPEVQIALLSKRIEELTEHLKVHKQDKHSRRGLTLLLGKRKRLLDYVEETNLEAFRELKKELGLR